MLMPFGKYRGEYVADLPEGYLRWLWETVDLREPLLSAVRSALEGVSDHQPEAVNDSSFVHQVYRRLSKKWHPDHGGSNAAMAAINDFYSALCGSTA
jgi:hypothetical protein